MTGKKLSNVEVSRILANPDLVTELEPDRIKILVDSTVESLVGTPIIVNVNSSQPIFVVGDLHGNFDSLHKIFNTFQSQGAESCVFLGDYVDRGDMSVEVLNFLLVVRQRYGPNIVLLRGNHEDPEVNKVYGFATELEVKGFTGLQPSYERLFQVLPIACVVNSTVLCVHGGIPRGITKIGELAMIGPSLQSPAIIQALWNDPIESPEVPTFMDNPRGPGIFYFGEQAFRNFMRANGFSKMIRAHEWQPEGFRWFFEGDLLSIFSAENYNGRMNPIGVAIIRGSIIEPQAFE